jgi:hypothetical protein
MVTTGDREFRTLASVLAVLAWPRACAEDSATPGDGGGEGAAEASLVCAGQMGVSVAELDTRYPPSLESFSGPTDGPQPVVLLGDGRTVVAEGGLPVASCEEVAAMAAPLLAPSVQKRDSVDGRPEFQVDLLASQRVSADSEMVSHVPYTSSDCTVGLQLNRVVPGGRHNLV